MATMARRCSRYTALACSMSCGLMSMSCTTKYSWRNGVVASATCITWLSRRNVTSLISSIATLGRPATRLHSHRISHRLAAKCTSASSCERVANHDIDSHEIIDVGGLVLPDAVRLLDDPQADRDQLGAQLFRQAVARTPEILNEEGPQPT